MVAFQKIGWPVLSEMYVAEQSSMKILSIFFSVPDSCHNSCCCCSVAKLCLTLWDPMNCSTPSFPVLHFFLVCSNSCPLSQWCYLNHLSVLSSSPFACLLSQHRIFSNELALSITWLQWIFRAGFLKDWLVWSCSPRDSQESSLAPQFKSPNSLALSLMAQLSHLYMTIGKTVAMTIWTFVGKMMSLLFNMLSSFVIAFQGASIF